MSREPTALVVDDDDGAREFAREALLTLGYEVLDAPAGPDALELIGGAVDPFDLLLTDLSMPGMSGTELARRVAAVSPRTAVLLMSGSPPYGMGRYDDLPPPGPFLAKPFTIEDLAGMLGEVLPAVESQGG